MTSHKPSIMDGMSAISKAQCYSITDMETLFQCSRRSIENWMTAGLIRGIKTGKKIVFPQSEVLRFQEEMLGKDISSLASIYNDLKIK